MKTIINKRTFQLTGVILMISVLFAACKKNNDEVVVNGEAKIKAVNTVQGSDSQDFYQNDTKLNTNAVAYAQSTEYLTVKGGVSSLFFKATGTQNVSASVNAGLANDASYTVFYYSDASGSGQIKGYEDDNTAPTSSKAKVRFINLGSALNNTINVNVAGGSTILTGLSYGNISAYSNIDANVDLSLTVLGSVTTTVIPGSSFQAGKIYTVWFDAANATTAQYHVVAQN
ncbi:MAG: DUF4397 domain-containing protein [Bacteroidota bacterium]